MKNFDTSKMLMSRDIMTSMNKKLLIKESRNRRDIRKSWKRIRFNNQNWILMALKSQTIIDLEDNC